MTENERHLTGGIIRTCDLSAEDKAAMRALMGGSFRGVDSERFARDLEEKPWTILLRDANGGIAGFSTLDLMSMEAGGRLIHAVYSGDTIIAASNRATTALPRAFLRFLMDHTGLLAGQDDWFWFYVCKGFRTYRFLPVFYQTFFPHPSYPTPCFEQSVMDGLARRRFGDAYDPASGVVRVTGDYALAGASDLTAERMADPFVGFFATRNPGWPQGEELVCLAPLRLGNLLSRPRRWLAEEMEAGQ